MSFSESLRSFKTAVDSAFVHGGRVTLDKFTARNLIDRVGSNFDDLQQAVQSWMQKQPWAPTQQPWELLLGVGEEVGELMRAHLKQHQKIRGSYEDWNLKGKDAIGDVVIFLVGYCAARGWSLQECVEVAKLEVLTRDWATYPKNGKTE